MNPIFKKHNDAVRKATYNMGCRLRKIWRNGNVGIIKGEKYTRLAHLYKKMQQENLCDYCGEVGFLPYNYFGLERPELPICKSCRQALFPDTKIKN